MEIPKLKYLSITGDISVEPVTSRIPDDPYPCLYIIMGPTGAGKSSLIEALAGESHKLSISKDQLAGYTQVVTAYRLVNVVHTKSETTHPVYVVDTPGFSDSKISEMEILIMVRKWSQDNRLHDFERIFYLTPITETRLPGSRRRTFEMLAKLIGSHAYSTSLIIITTMWDTVHNEGTRNRAESNFQQLRDEILKEFVQRPSTDVMKFMNTRNSALLAIDHRGFSGGVFTDYKASTFPHLYQDLHGRIQGALQEKKIIELGLTQCKAQTNAELRAILKRNQRENHATLTKFIDQFVNFGRLPPACKDAAHHLRKSIVANARPANIKHRIYFWKWAREPDLADDVESDDRAEASQPRVLKYLGHFAVEPSKRRIAKLLKHGE